MNKVLKGLVAVAATAAMAVAGFAGASTAMAADTYAVSVDQSDSHTYDAYQVFTGTLSKDGSTLSDLKWGANSKRPEGVSVGDSVDETTVKTLTGLAGKANKEIQGEVNKYVDFNSTAIATGITKDAPKQLAAGYYVFKDVTAVANGDALSLHLTKVVGSTTLQAKKDVPEVEKKVKENVKATDQSGYGTQYNDTADYNIGDEVPFHLIGSVPDMSNYDTYKYIFHDTLDAAFDAPATTDVKVYLSSDKIKDDTDSDITKQATVEVTNNNITVTFGNLKTVGGVTNGKYIIVEYSAKLNSGAVIGGNGNRNSVYLEYSNNPNQSGTGDSDNTGRTPDDKVVVFTYELDTTKVDKNDSNKKLEGAKFKLYRGSGEEKQYAQVTDGKVSGWTTEANATELSSDAQGLFKVTGLDDGTYYLEETVAPDGYNKLTNPVTVIISADTTNGQEWTNYDQTPLIKIDVTVDGTKGTGNAAAGTAAITVANVKGNTLPSTGGMGTVLLYVAGVAVFALAGVTLVMALRRRNA